MLPLQEAGGKEPIMILKARLEIKFRAFGRDWGKPLVKTFAIQIPVISSRLISFSDRGVTLLVDVEKA